MKLIVLTLIFLEMLSCNATAEWVRISENNRLVHYADTAISKSGDMVKVWSMYDYKSVQESPRSGRRYLSEKSQGEIDCRAERLRVLFASWHAEQMGNGAVVYTSPKIRDWEPTSSPNSIAANLWQFACGKEESKSIINDTMIKTASDMNKQLPMMVDKDTRLDNVAVLNQRYKYFYTMVSSSYGDFNQDYLAKNFAPIVKNRVCTTKEMKSIFDNKYTVDYVYRDKNGKNITTITITPKECGY